MLSLHALSKHFGNPITISYTWLLLWNRDIPLRSQFIAPLPLAAFALFPAVHDPTSPRAQRRLEVIAVAASCLTTSGR